MNAHARAIVGAAGIVEQAPRAQASFVVARGPGDRKSVR
jgi:hypothetical protein